MTEGGKERGKVSWLSHKVGSLGDDNGGGTVYDEFASFIIHHGRIATTLYFHLIEIVEVAAFRLARCW